jgi:predicted GTPase
MSFYKPDLTITVIDPHRPGHELSYYPGATNLRLADVALINKVDSVGRLNVEKVRKNIYQVRPDALVIEAASPITVDDESVIKGKRVLVVEDGPTLTHGEMGYGAGFLAANRYGASEIIDPHPWAVGSIAATFRKYPMIGGLLPAMGYGPEQLHDLEETINRTLCDSVVVGTPINLQRILKINKPAVRVRYELQETTEPDLAEVLDSFLKRHRSSECVDADLIENGVIQ